MRRWFGGLALAAVTSAGIACGGCPGLSGTAEEAPVELEWPDASPLAPVQPIDPAGPPPAPVVNRHDGGPEQNQRSSDSERAPADADEPSRVE